MAYFICYWVIRCCSDVVFYAWAVRVDARPWYNLAEEYEHDADIYDIVKICPVHFERSSIRRLSKVCSIRFSLGRADKGRIYQRRWWFLYCQDQKSGWKQNGPILRGQSCAWKESGVCKASRWKYRISFFKRLGGASAEEEAPRSQDRPPDLGARPRYSIPNDALGALSCYSTINHAPGAPLSTNHTHDAYLATIKVRN